MYDLTLIVGYTALAILAVILAAAIVDPDDWPK